MKQKERYYSLIDNNGNFELRDYECGKTIHSLFELDDLLNQQDKQIKELEELKKFNFDYRDRCQLEEYQRWADKEITQLTKLYDKLNKKYCEQQDELIKIKENNKQIILDCVIYKSNIAELDKAQTKLVVKELEKLKTTIVSERKNSYFKFDNFNKGKDTAYYWVIEIINSQIEKLRGAI